MIPIHLSLNLAVMPSVPTLSHSHTYTQTPLKTKNMAPEVSKVQFSQAKKDSEITEQPPHLGTTPLCLVYNSWEIYGAHINQSKALTQAFFNLRDRPEEVKKLGEDPLNITFLEYYPKNWRQFMEGGYWKFIDVYLTEPRANLINRCTSGHLKYPENWREFLSDLYRPWASLL